MAAPDVKSTQPAPDLKAYKDKAMDESHKAQGVLRQKTDQAKQKYLDPAAHYVVKQAQAQPVLTGFLGIFFALSFFPILTFTLFALGTAFTIGGTAFSIVFMTSAFVIGSAALLLLGTLSVTAFLSACAVFWLLSAWSSYRLVANVLGAPDLPQGLKTFVGEMRGLILGVSPSQMMEQSTKG